MRVFHVFTCFFCPRHHYNLRLAIINLLKSTFFSGELAKFPHFEVLVSPNRFGSCVRTPAIRALRSTPVIRHRIDAERESSHRGARSVLNVREYSLVGADKVLRNYRPDYSMISVTTPDPTVLPPSLIANLSPSSIAIGVISLICMVMLSPGMHISVPSGRVRSPVTSVVLK